jgi:hypothetical protein
MKNALSKIQAFLRKIGYSNWRELAEAVRRQRPILEECLRSDPEQLFKAALIKAWDGTPPPDANAPKTKELLSALDKMPQEDLELARLFQGLPEAARRQLDDLVEEQLKPLEALWDRVERLERALDPRSRSGIAGRRRVPPGLKEQVVCEVNDLTKRKHKRKQDAVQEVAFAHGISSRTLWRILSEAKRSGQGGIFVQDVTEPARAPEAAAKAFRAQPVGPLAAAPQQSTRRRAAAEPPTQSTAPHRRR